jgi:DNA polymerase elongation subunit (family B)
MQQGPDRPAPIAQRENTVLYGFDIETLGLDPTVDDARVVSVAACSTSESVVFDNNNERVLLDDVAAWLDNPSRTRGVLVTWNGSAFDWPYLQTRARLVGSRLDAMMRLVQSDLRAPAYQPIGGHTGGYLVDVAGWDHADVMRAWKPWAKANNMRAALKVVARAHGIDVIEVDRERINELSRTELVAYNLSDVEATRILAEKLGDDIDAWLDSASNA